MAPLSRSPGQISRLELPSLAQGRGRAHAPIVWLGLASALTHGGSSTRVYLANATIAERTGCPLRAVELGLAALRRAGKISVEYGARGKYGYGRIVTMHLTGDGPNPRVRLPKPKQVAELWARAHGERERPATIVALALAAYVLAADQLGKLRGRCEIRPKLVRLRALVGASAGHTFSARLDALASAGIIERAGELWRDGITLITSWVDRVVEAIVHQLRPRLSPLRLLSCSAPGHIEWTGPPPIEGADWELVHDVG